MEYIPRSIESVVLHSMQTFKCVLLTGARQTGKSTLLRHLFPETHYVSIDDPFIEDQANDNPDMFMILNPPPSIIDEVQRAPGLFRYIKIRCDGTDVRGLYCLSGSQPLALMERASESLAGRVCIVELSGLSLREVQKNALCDPFVPTMEYIQKRHPSAKKPDDLWAWIHRGSYPELQNPEVDWAAFYSSYIKTYLERDVRKLSAVHDLDDYRRFMISVAARTGQMLNYANIADEIGKDAMTVRKWMSILEASGIIYLLEPFTPNALKKAIRTPKVYFRDTGLASYLTRWLTPETLAYGAQSGAMFETYVVSEILKSYANHGVDYRYCVSYYRGRDKKKTRRNGQVYETDREIDLIIEENGTLYPIEIKQGTTVTASEAESFMVLDSVPEKKRGMGGIVCCCPQPNLLRENIMQIPVWYI